MRQSPETASLIEDDSATEDTNEEAIKAAADAEVERLSRELLAERRRGTEADQERLVQLDTELRAVSQRASAAALRIQQKREAIPFGEKLYALRVAHHDRHQAVVARGAEKRRALAARNSTRDEIEAFERSDEFAILRENERRRGLGEQMSDFAIRVGIAEAALHEKLENAECTLKRAERLEAEAKHHWERAHHLVRACEETVGRLPNGAKILASIPQPGHDHDALPHATLEIGPNAVPSGDQVMRDSAPAEGGGNQASARTSRTPHPAAASRADSSSPWDHAARKNNARHGLGPPAAAFTPAVPIFELLANVNAPGVFSQLVERKNELSEEQRIEAIMAYRPAGKAKTRKKRKAATANPAQTAEPESPPTRRRHLSPFKFRN